MDDDFYFYGSLKVCENYSFEFDTENFYVPCNKYLNVKEEEKQAEPEDSEIGQIIIKDSEVRLVLSADSDC